MRLCRQGSRSVVRRFDRYGLFVRIVVDACVVARFLRMLKVNVPGVRKVRAWNCTMPTALFDAVSIVSRGMVLSLLLMLVNSKVKAPSCGVRPSRVFLAISWIVAVSGMYSLTKEALEIPFAGIVSTAFCSDTSCHLKNVSSLIW